MRLTLLPDSDQTFEIKRTGVRVSVGRKQGCDIILNDIVVSGLHCYITVVSTVSAVIEDQSTNGTYVNGVKIGKGMTLELKNGDILTLGKPTAAGAQTGSVNFKVSFDGSESETAASGVGSFVYKQQIEDLKVAASTAQHRSEVSEKKAMEAGMKLGSVDSELKKTREDNVELSVRNEVMRGEIEQLRLRLINAERSANDNEKRAEALQAKIDMMSREYDEIQTLKVSLNLKHTSLSQEIERLRQENFDLRNRVTISGDMKKRLASNLLQIQQLAGATGALLEDNGFDSNTTGGYGGSQPAPLSPIVQVKRSKETLPTRGQWYGYTDRGVEQGLAKTPEEYDIANFAGKTITADDLK
jgi:pSer/pThr/pTyr-binding forkhead associated (FHA) protein